VGRMRIATGRLPWAVPVAVVAVMASATVLAGVGAAAAAQHQARTVPVSGEPLRGQATDLALASNCGVTFARDDLYIADGIAIRKVGPSDFLTTPFDRGYICGMAVDHWGNLVFANVTNYKIQVLAEKTGTFYGQAMTAKHVYTLAGTGKRGISASGLVATQADLSGPYDMVIDAHGNIVFGDCGYKYLTSKERHRHYGAVVQVVAVKSGTFYHHKMIAGDLYTVAGHWGGSGDSGEGGLATSASLGRNIIALALDKSGNIAIADTYNNRVEVIAEKTGTFYGQAMTDDHMYSVAGTGTAGYSGDGGPGTSAAFDQPEGVAVDHSGNLVIADSYNDRVRVLAGSTGTFYGQPMTAGDVYTIVGTGTGGFSGDGGPAIDAEIYWPASLAVTPSGGLVIDDYNNERDRYVPSSTGTFFGQPMTAGSIYTIAGNGQYKQ
jgi:trimeric autotransporter adhesin